MKTEKSKTKVNVFKDMNSNAGVKQGKKLAVGIKTEAFGDKENLVKCRLPLNGDNHESKSLENEDASKDKRNKTSENEEPIKEKIMKKITAEDLTSEAGPSEVYWETLAEKRRKALEEALHENITLHEKIELLQKENETLKQALAEATEVIQMFNEIADEENLHDEESTHNVSSDEESNNKSTPKSSPLKSAFGDESTILNETDDSVKQ